MAKNQGASYRLRDLQKMHRCRHAVAKVHLGLLIEMLSSGSKQKDAFLNFFVIVWTHL